MTAQALMSGTFGTEPFLERGRGDERRFFGRTTAGSFSGLGVTGPSRNSKPTLSRPFSSLSTMTRTWPPPLSLPNSTSSASGFLMCSWMI